MSAQMMRLPAFGSGIVILLSLGVFVIVYLVQFRSPRNSFGSPMKAAGVCELATTSELESIGAPVVVTARSAARRRADTMGCWRPSFPLTGGGTLRRTSAWRTR
jgi:hypothetical protein